MDDKNTLAHTSWDFEADQKRLCLSRIGKSYL